MAAISDKVISQLKNYANEDKDAMRVLKILGSKSRSSTRTDLYRLRHDTASQGFSLDPESILRIFSKFEKLGLGKIRRRPLPLHDAFTWVAIVQEIANQVLGPSLERRRRGEGIETTKTDLTHRHPPLKPSITHTVDLYATIDGSLVHLQLPAPWTRSKAEQLSKFLNQIAERSETTG